MYNFKLVEVEKKTNIPTTNITIEVLFMILIEYSGTFPETEISEFPYRLFNLNLVSQDRGHFNN